MELWAFGLLLVLKFLGILLPGQQAEVVQALLWPAVIFWNNCVCVCVLMEAQCPHVPAPLHFVAYWPFVGIKP